MCRVAGLRKPPPYTPETHRQTSNLENAMAFQSAPNMAEVVVRGLCNFEEVLCVLNFLVSTPPYDQTDIENLAAAVDGWWSGEILPNLSTDYLYVESAVKGLTDENDFYAENSSGAGAGGTASPSLPNNVTFAIKHTTAFTGRSARGRNYLPGLPTSALASNPDLVLSTWVTTILAAYSVLETYVNPAGWVHVVLSRFSGGAARPVGVAFIVNNYSVSDFTIDTQRRRLP